MSSSNLSLEQIKTVYDNNFYLLQEINNNNNCFDPQIIKSGNCKLEKMYWALVNQNSYLKNLINTQIKTTNSVNNRKFSYQTDQTVYLMYINYILFIVYYVIAFLFLIFLIYRVFFSNSSSQGTANGSLLRSGELFKTIKKFLYNYLLIILLILFYPFYIRPITLIVINTFKYIYSIINSDVYISEKY